MAENKAAAHTFLKSGVYYFIRRVPSDLKHHYTSEKISYSLRTRSVAVAGSRAARAAQQLDEYWYHLRIRDCDLPGKHMLRLAQNTDAAPMMTTTQPSASAVKLSEAVGIYLRLKGAGRPVTFHRAAERSCGYVIDVCEDKNITAYTKADANAFRDDLIKRGLAGSSITRVFGSVRSVINFAASEIGTDLTNPFGRVYYDRSAGVEEREEEFSMGWSWAAFLVATIVLFVLGWSRNEANRNDRMERCGDFGDYRKNLGFAVFG